MPRIESRQFGTSRPPWLSVSWLCSSLCDYDDRRRRRLAGTSCTLIVPFAAGGITDTLAVSLPRGCRLRSARPLYVENLTGAAGRSRRARRPFAAGRLQLLFSTLTQIAVVPLTTKSGTSDKGLRPVSIIATSPFVLTTDATFPAKTLADSSLRESAPGDRFSYGSAGAGSLSHISAAVASSSAQAST